MYKPSVLLVLLAACSRLNAHPAPEVEQAREYYEAGAADAALPILSRYLQACPGFDAGLESRKLAAEFDQGLVLFQLMQNFGGKGARGAENPEATQAAPADPALIACALQTLDALLAVSDLSKEARIETLYLRGNLLLLLNRKLEALAAYDQTLELGGGATDKNQGAQSADVLRNAAFNRALCLDTPPDAGSDSSTPPDASPDASDASSDGGESEAGSDGGAPDGGGIDGGSDGGGDSGPSDAGGGDGSKGDGADSGIDAGEEDASPPDNDSEDAGLGPDAAPSEVLDERILEQLDKTPSLQRELARRNQRRTKPLEDK